MTKFELNNRNDYDSTDKIRNSKVIYKSADDILENPLNAIYQDGDTEEELNNLAESIKEIGLQHPLTVYECDNKYTLISGHRRLKAIKNLLAEKEVVKYNGLNILWDSVPVIVMRVYKTEEEQFKALIASNNYRCRSKETQEKIIERAIKIYNDNFDKYSNNNERTRDVIGKIAGVSGRTIGRYVEFDNNKHAEMKKINRTENQEIINKINTMIKYVNKLNLNDLNNLERKNVKDKLYELSDAISKKN